MSVGDAWRPLAAAGALVVAAVGITAVPGVAEAGFTCSSGGAVYEVQRGDSWYGIAGELGVVPSALAGANDADLDDLLVAGDRLCVPDGADLSAVCPRYTVEAGDSWAAIGHRVDSTASRVAGANGVGTGSTIHPGDEICLPPGTTAASGGSSGSSGPGSYTVVRGDSWAWIASRADVSLRSLLAANDARASDLIVPGQVVRLPAGATVPTGAATVRLQAAPTQGPCGFGDTWGDGRSGGRSHRGTDLFPGRGAYVYAVVDGRLTSRIWDGAGRNAGNAWSLTGADGTRFFYAHLQDFAPDLSVGSRVRAGQIIGWVGDTGNSSSPHLHLEIRPGGGPPVNPYPILRAQGGCNDGTPYTQPGGWVPD